MIRLAKAEGRSGHRRFLAAAHRVLRPFPNARSTEDDVMRMLVEQRSVFLEHAQVLPFILTEGDQDVGHVALIHDENLPEYVQAAFFGAAPGLLGVSAAIREVARRTFPTCHRLVVGLNGHLNYSAGLLAGPHDAPPLFGLNWTPPYYAEYWSELTARPMVSFRFDTQPFYDFARSFGRTFDPGPVRVRTMNRKDLKREVALYTELNNACFGEHPYWSNRTPAEDLELFWPFRFLIKEENLLFAEKDGETIGFLLWYPDFQELVSKNDEAIGLSHVLRYHLLNPIRSVRLTEIAVKKAHRRSMAVPAMILEMIRRVEEGPYRFCEGGFIFEENRSSLALTLRFIERAIGRKLEPFRRFVVFDGEL